jgi:hypothetical protein
MIWIGASISPFPFGFSSEVLMLTSGLTRWRVIWMRPNLLGGKDFVFGFIVGHFVTQEIEKLFCGFWILTYR